MDAHEDQGRTYGIELLLQEPEIVAWLEDHRRPEPDETDDDDPPRAA